LHKGWDVEFIEKNLIFRRIHSGSVAGQSSLRHIDIRDYIRIYNRYASALIPAELFRLHAEACFKLVRRMARSILSRNLQRFVSAVRTFFWVLGELLRGEFLRLLGREALGRIKRLDPGWQ